MKRWIDQIDDSNFRDIESKLTQYYSLINSITILPESPPVQEKKPKEIPAKEIEKIEESELPTLVKENQDKTSDTEIENGVEKEPAYIFQRKLRGGTLSAINAFVPEGITRRLGIEHGDLVRADKISTDSGGKIRYSYSLHKKMNKEDNSGIKDLNHCIIEKESETLVVKESLQSGETIRFDGVSFTAILSQSDINHFSLTEGDIVDISYLEENPSENVVTWLHKDENNYDESSKPRKTLKPKKAHLVDTTKEVVEEVKKTLNGQEILIIGNPGNPVQYEEHIEKRGGHSKLVDSNEKVERLAPMVKKASFVIFLLGTSGHVRMKQVKQLCKDNNVPFEATFHQGISSVVRTAEKLANMPVGL
ncbi:DUF2325 domain-containing protein [Rossellomorea marisflavi]|uniref:DUF2325 domain-containing protein n=1 Tax=Rossellomorea marisflavi TaxID=189381 RepID=UPI003FA07A3B